MFVLGLFVTIVCFRVNFVSLWPKTQRFFCVPVAILCSSCCLCVSLCGYYASLCGYHTVSLYTWLTFHTETSTGTPETLGLCLVGMPSYTPMVQSEVWTQADPRWNTLGHWDTPFLAFCCFFVLHIERHTCLIYSKIQLANYTWCIMRNKNERGCNGRPVKNISGKIIHAFCLLTLPSILPQ